VAPPTGGSRQGTGRSSPSRKPWRQGVHADSLTGTPLLGQISGQPDEAGLAGAVGRLRQARGGEPQDAGDVLALLTATAGTAAPIAHADNKRLNDGVVANVYTIQHQAGCTNNIRINPQLQLAAQWHTRDVLTNRDLDEDTGSDGSTPQTRAAAAGFIGTVAETVAINPALAISSVEILNQWYYNPAYLAIMQNCDHTQIGVWSEHSLDRTIVVAIYGQPA
jgi:uncharacterized protein YkwD